jgi:hypothetical protein
MDLKFCPNVKAESILIIITIITLLISFPTILGLEIQSSTLLLALSGFAEDLNMTELL